MGYLSILLCILCLDSDVRLEVGNCLDGEGLSAVLSTVDEFVQYHQTVDQHLHVSKMDSKDETAAAFTTRLHNIVEEVRRSEMRQ